MSGSATNPAIKTAIAATDPVKIAARAESDLNIFARHAISTE
jgi:hypothetical protein